MIKKETVILAVVIAFLAGFITGATVAILKGKKGSEKVVAAPTVESAPGITPQGPPPEETVSQIALLKDVVKKDPRNLSAWGELGNLYFDSGQPKEAIDAYGRYLSIKPNNPDIRTDMGIMYRALGEFDQALAEFKKAAADDPNHVNSRYNIGIVLLHDKGDIKGALTAWEDYLRVDPNSERAERVRAQMENMKKMVK